MSRSATPNEIRFRLNPEDGLNPHAFVLTAADGKSIKFDGGPSYGRLAVNVREIRFAPDSNQCFWFWGTIQQLDDRHSGKIIPFPGDFESTSIEGFISFDYNYVNIAKNPPKPWWRFW